MIPRYDKSRYVLVFLNLFLLTFFIGCSVAVEPSFTTPLPTNTSSNPYPAPTEQQALGYPAILDYSETRPPSPTLPAGYITPTTIVITVNVAVNTPEPTPTLEVGIIEDIERFQNGTVRVVKTENVWQGFVNGKFTRVFVGQLFPDSRIPSQTLTYHGAIYVVTYKESGAFNVSLHTTEAETGALRIVEALPGDRLKLVSAGYEALASQTFYFDLVTLQLTEGS